MARIGEFYCLLYKNVLSFWQLTQYTLTQYGHHVWAKSILDDNKGDQLIQATWKLGIFAMITKRQNVHGPGTSDVRSARS